DKRVHESCGFARASICQTDKVAASQNVRDRAILNRRRQRIAPALKVLVQTGYECKVREAVRWHEGLLSLRLDRAVHKPGRINVLALVLWSAPSAVLIRSRATIRVTSSRTRGPSKGSECHDVPTFVLG